MRKIFLLFFSPFFLFADVEINDNSQNSQGVTNIQIKQNDSKGVFNVHVNEAPALPPIVPGIDPTVVVDEKDTRIVNTDVDLRARAHDFVETFYRIKEENPDAKIYAIIKGATLSRLTDVEMAKGETLLRFYYKSGRKIRVKTVPVEDVEELNYW